MFDQPDRPNAGLSPVPTQPRTEPVGAIPTTLRLRSLRIYQISDALAESLVYFMVLFSPWAFGTTQRWSIWTMTVTGYFLGILLLIKLYIRWFRGYHPLRWGQPSSNPQLYEGGGTTRWASFLTVVLALLTVAILGYGLIAALNARSTYRADLLSFEYHHYVTWLPHSYAGKHSWFAFWNYLGLALSFWSVRDWLLGTTSAEARAIRGQAFGRGTFPHSVLPARLRRLFWVLAINAALICVVGIVQRASGTDKVLWLVKPRIEAGAFGPYNYQSNAAQYFNLVWPISLGFWWTLRREARRGLRPRNRMGSGGHHVLLLCAMVTAIGSLVSNSKAGAIIGAVNIVGATAILLLGRRHRERLTKLGIYLAFMTTLLLGVYFGWEQLGPRMEQIREAYEDRESMYRTARLMTQDCPVFGTGPGTFEPLFQLYRSSADEYWPAQLHNDWLETRITFGWLGSTLIGLALLVALARWFAPGGIRGSWRFTALLWLALAGCLAHARFDFPFQVHSLMFLFLLQCSVLSVLSTRS